MTLDELLALIPDNDEGQIDADDLQTIVTELFNRAGNTMGQAFAYKWTTTATPPSGRIRTDTPWDMSATKLWVSEIADDGASPTFNILGDANALARIWVATTNGTKLVADVTGPAIDLGTYREIPIAVIEVIGPAPANNDPVTVTAVVSLA
jgi:hypothetical protein